MEGAHVLTYELERRGAMSRYEYLYRCLRDDIACGVVAPREKLPSKRALARHLGVSLITVENAYAQLVAEGYVYAIQRKGYYASDLNVSLSACGPGGAVRRMAKEGLCETHREVNEAAFTATAPAAPVPPAPAPMTSAYADTSAAEQDASPLIADFTGGAGLSAPFPYRMWARTVRAVLAEESERSLAAAAADAAGSRRLREAIASYLLGFRGMRVDPSQIIIGAGAQTLYHTIIQLIGRDRRLAVEDPGYPRLTSVYRANDVDVVQVPLDAHGVSMRTLRQCGADALHCMPSHQFPTGLVTSVSRRYELLGWASEYDRYLIEDDYDCEFRLAGRPIPTLQSIDASERVIYVNTFTKSLGAAFRIGYLVLPPHLAEAFRCNLGFYSSTVGAIDQLALARFIEQGDYERHVNRSRSRCRTVRAELVSALKASPLGSRLSVEGVDAGLHFVLNIATCARDATVVAAARAAGLALVPLKAYCATDAACEAAAHHFVINDAALDPAAIEGAAAALCRAVAAAEA